MRHLAGGGLLVVLLAWTASATPLGPACVPTCEISTSQFANTPAVVVLTTGVAVTWSSGDGARHTATSEARCMDVSILAASPGSVSFAVQDGTLHAIDRAGARRVCPEAAAAGASAFVLPYKCSIHPAFQQGVLVVVAGTS